jgi:serine/threonine protein phosphatase PrpC
LLGQKLLQVNMMPEPNNDKPIAHQPEENMTIPLNAPEIAIEIALNDDLETIPLPSVEQTDLQLLPQPKAKWKNLPVPDGPDKHPEHFAKGMPAPNGMKLIGARVRGKSHKHAGTNCDDWFEFNIAEDWVIMAVADGVGSKQLSRIGAKEACSAAVNKLTEAMGKIVLTEKTDIKQFEDRGDNYRFPDADMNAVEEALSHAMDAAYHALETSRDDRKGAQEYIDLLGRPLEVNDFSTTLLLAVHSYFSLHNNICDFVMSLQVGDGMIAAILADDTLKLLGRADSGEFAGQVMPINNRKIREEKEKRGRIFTYIGRLKAIMLMTDGVADDYFPNQPEILNLYRDLIKEKIIKPAELLHPESSINAGLDTPQPWEALRTWLDSYEVKGSFDDRTLVVLYGEQNI